MGQMGTTRNKARERSVSAVAQFVELMHALERGELRVAAEAQDHLADLGVVVKVLGYACSEDRGEEPAC